MLSYTTELMYAYYNPDKLFFMSNTITEIIPATREARLAVNLEEWLKHFHKINNFPIFS